jgi:hypothetical protein
MKEVSADDLENAVKTARGLPDYYRLPLLTIAEKLRAQQSEIEKLRADLWACRSSVKTELNHYERLALVHGKTPLAANYEAEAQRLDALLDRIDAVQVAALSTSSPPSVKIAFPLKPA